MKTFYIISIAVLAVFLSIWFLVEGYSGPDVEISTPSASDSKWINTQGGTLEHFVCPGNGKVVGDVWENGTWSAHAYSRTSWDKLEENYDDRLHAEKAVEQFVQNHGVCK
jgi:hypothetical protein